MNLIEFKTKAKDQLNGNWKIPILATFIVLVVEFIFQIPSFVNTFNFYMTGIQPQTNNFQDLFNSIILLFVSGIFDIALSYLFLELAKNTKKITFDSFLQGLNLWHKGISVIVWNSLWTFFWALLFFIPGIIKSIAYSQMSFIVAENPTITAKKAMKMSIAMTKGYKGDLFLLALSFFGWIVLSLITGGIVFLWIKPYIKMTFVNVYQYLKKQALENNTLRYEDFGMTRPENTISTQSLISTIEESSNLNEKKED